VQVNLDPLVPVKWKEEGEAEATIWVKPMSWLERDVHREALRPIGPEAAPDHELERSKKRKELVMAALIERTDHWDNVDAVGTALPCTAETKLALFSKYSTPAVDAYLTIVGAGVADPTRPIVSGPGQDSSGSGPESTAGKDTTTGQNAPETGAVDVGAAAS